MSAQAAKGLKTVAGIVLAIAAIAAPFIALGQYRAESDQIKRDVSALQHKTERLSEENAANRRLLERIDERTLEIQRQLRRLP